MIMKSRLLTLLTSCLLLWGGNLPALSAPDDEFNPENPADPSAIDYCRLTVTADPIEGAYVSGSGRYTVGKDGQVYITTSERNTEEYTYTFQYWTLNGERTSYSQYFYFTPQKGTFEFVAHYEKKEVVFDPENPQDPSSENIKRKYRLYLTSNIEGACTFNMASGNKVEEKQGLWLYVNYQASYYKFEGWKLNGTIISTNENLYYTMPSAETTLQACFSEIPFDPENPIDPNSSGTNVDNSTRLLIDLCIGTEDNTVDKTRVVVNEAKTLGYDIGTDAQKMISNDAAFQIYSLDNNGTKYSINERPREDGIVPLGIVVKNAGKVTISASRMDYPILLYDKVMDKNLDIAANDYTFDSNAGTIEGRFYLKIAETITIITAKSYTIEYGDDIPVFEYTSKGSTVEGTPSISCEATKNSPAGTYPIVINKGTVTNSNDSYFDGTLTIKKAPLTITAKDYTIKQGQALPTFEATYEGFKNSETSAVLTKQPTISTNATSASNPDEYDITISSAEAQNYEISYVNGKLTIVNADALIITANSYTIEYGDDLPKFEYTSEGATIEGTPSITCDATKTSPAGTYTILISKGSVTNYNDTYVNGTLTITKAPLKITAKDYTIKQGEALPTFEATYEGFKNDETSEVLTKQPTITTTVTSASEPGEYAITVSDAEAQNYEISYVSGILTIEALPYIPGDANADGMVDVLDVTDIANHIMGKPTSTGKFDEEAADLNGDKVVNATDIVLLVKKLAGEQ